MKKLVISIIIVLLFSQSAMAKREGKLALGLVLTAIGAVMAQDGFREVIDREWNQIELDYTWQKDVSNPQITITKNGWWKEKIISWWAHHDWEIKNTGNVTITDVDVTLVYYDAYGTYIGGYTFSNNFLYVNDTTGQDDWLTNFDVEPYSAYTGYKIDSYIHKYETQYVYKTVHYKTMKQNNPVQGYIGVTVACYGIYTFFDSVAKDTKVSKFMNKHNLNVNLMNDYDCVKMVLTKRI